MMTTRLTPTPNVSSRRGILRRTLLALAVIVALVGGARLLSSLAVKHGMRVVHYHGAKYTVSRTQPEYSDAQADAIMRVAIHDRPPLTAASYQVLINYLNTLEVPGYGSSTGGFGDVTVLGKFTYISVQLPKKALHRVMIYRADAGGTSYAYFDDFLIKGIYPPSFRFVSEGEQVVYLDERSHRGVKRVRVRGRTFTGFAKLETIDLR